MFFHALICLKLPDDLVHAVERFELEAETAADIHDPRCAGVGDEFGECVDVRLMNHLRRVVMIVRMRQLLLVAGGKVVRRAHGA